MRAVAGYRLAVGTFTRVPSGEVSTDTETARSALLLAPLAVLPLALLVTLIGATVEVGVTPFIASGLVLVALAYGTRAMHLDGLADTIDGLGAGWNRQRALEVMRSGDVGPMGAAGLVLTLVLQAAAMSVLLAFGWRGALVVGALVMASRASCARVCTTGTTAAPGSTLGKVFVGAVPVWEAWILQLLMIGLVLLAVTPLANVLGVAFETGGTARLGLVTALAVLLSSQAAVFLRKRATRTFGGVNGDVLGAGVEVALTILLVLMTVAW